MIDSDSKDQVSKTIDVVSEVIESPLQPTVVVLPIDNPEPQEVISDVPQVIDNNFDDAINVVVVDTDIPNRYELPAKITKGIQPFRKYDHDFKALRTSISS